MRAIPKEIATGCVELDEAWRLYSHVIWNESEILIADTEEALNWHAFLGHSLDMQGFRAAEFAGVDQVSKPAPGFISLKQRGIGVRELGSLWEIDRIRDYLRHGTKGKGLESTYEVLESAGGGMGRSLAQSLAKFPFRKGHKYIRGLLQNSAHLKEHGYSFRCWLAQRCNHLGATGFPPRDFRQEVRTGNTLERALCRELEDTFYMVGPEIAPYMICDWQLWLFREEKTGPFDSYKQDSFHDEFVSAVNGRHGDQLIPNGKAGFVRWWYERCPAIPPRLANECIWLTMEARKA